MATNPEFRLFIDLINKKNMSLDCGTYDSLDAPVKASLITWLNSRNFPSDNPPDLVGTDFVTAWFGDNAKLIIFGLSYEEEEQCGGTVVFSLVNNVSAYVFDNVECSD